MKRARSYKFVKKSARRQKKTKKQQRNKLMKGGGKCTIDCLVPSIPPLGDGVPKILISKLLDTPNDPTIEKYHIADVPKFTAGGAADPFATTPYDRQKLIHDYYILHIDNKYYFIHKATYDPQKTLPTIVEPEARTYKVYILQYLMDDINNLHGTHLTVGGNGNNAKVLVSLHNNLDKTKFIYGEGQTLPLLLKDRTIIDIDGTEGVKYEDSLLMAYVDVPGTPYTELPKTIIYRILSDPVTYGAKIIRIHTGLNSATVGQTIFHPSQYEVDELVAKCHILHVFDKHFFIPKTQYGAVLTAAGAGLDPLTLAFTVYVLQDLVDTTNTDIQVNPGGGAAAAPGKVICELRETNGHFDFGGANSFPVLGRKQRDIIDLDGGDGVKYEDSLLSTFVTAPAGAIPTKLAKTLIRKLLETNVAQYDNFKKTQRADLNQANVLLETAAAYECQKLIHNYHVLNVFGKYFFISKKQYNDKKTAANPGSPRTWNYDVYVLQDLMDNSNPRLRFYIYGHQNNNNSGKVICKLESTNHKFDFSGIPYPVFDDGDRKIIDLDGRPNYKYADSLLQKRVANAAVPTPRVSPKSVMRGAHPTYMSIAKIKELPSFTIVDINNLLIGGGVQNPTNTITKELTRTYVTQASSFFGPRLESNLIFYHIQNRLFCMVNNDPENILFEVKKYHVPTHAGGGNFYTYLLTYVVANKYHDSDSLKNKYYIIPNNTNDLSVLVQTADDLVINKRIVTKIEDITGLQTFSNPDSPIKTFVNTYVAAEP